MEIVTGATTSSFCWGLRVDKCSVVLLNICCSLWFCVPLWVLQCFCFHDLLRFRFFFLFWVPETVWNGNLYKELNNRTCLEQHLPYNKNKYETCLEEHLWYNKNKFIKQIYLQAIQNTNIHGIEISTETKQGQIE